MAFTSRLSIGVALWAAPCALLGSVCLASAASAAPRHAMDVEGNAFLGGTYVEVGIAANGALGPPAPRAASFSGTPFQSSIALSVDLDGFGSGSALAIDYVLPGVPEERWSVGFVVADGLRLVTTSAREDAREEALVFHPLLDASEGSLLSVTATATLERRLEVSQTLSFDDAAHAVTFDVALVNVGDDVLPDVRYLRSLDPDNTAFRGGAFETENEVLLTHRSGDPLEVVCAQTFRDDDPVFLALISRAPLCLVTADVRARVSRLALNSSNPYLPAAFDAPPAKGVVRRADERLAITFAFGALEPGGEARARFLLSVDPRPVTPELVSEWREALGGEAVGMDEDASLLGVDETVDVGGQSPAVNDAVDDTVDEAADGNQAPGEAGDAGDEHAGDSEADGSDGDDDNSARDTADGDDAGGASSTDEHGDTGTPERGALVRAEEPREPFAGVKADDLAVDVVSRRSAATSAGAPSNPTGCAAGAGTGAVCCPAALAVFLWAVPPRRRRPGRSA